MTAAFWLMVAASVICVGIIPLPAKGRFSWFFLLLAAAQVVYGIADVMEHDPFATAVSFTLAGLLLVVEALWRVRMVNKRLAALWISPFPPQDTDGSAAGRSSVPGEIIEDEGQP